MYDLDREDTLPFDIESIRHQTDKAWFLQVDGNDIWFPKSQCQIDEEAMVVAVPRWLAEEKGLSE